MTGRFQIVKRQGWWHIVYTSNLAQPVMRTRTHDQAVKVVNTLIRVGAS